MEACTFGLYKLYWFYRHWSCVKASTGEDVWPFWRSMFAGIFCFPLFSRIIDTALQDGIPVPFSSTQLGVAFFLSTICWRLPDPFWLLAFLSVVPMIPVQRAANAVSLQRAPDTDANARLTAANWFGVAFGSLCVSVISVGSFLPARMPATSQAFLSTLAAEANKGLPRSVDDQTRLLEVIGSEGMLVYRYQLLNYAAYQIDTNRLRGILRPRLIASACGAPETHDQLLTHGVTLRHIYFDKLLAHVLTIDITAADCKPDTNGSDRA